MPIPSTQDLGFEGAEWWNTVNGFPSPWQRPRNALKSGNMCHYVAADGTHVPTQIGAINGTSISVQQTINGRVTTVCNVAYDDQTFAPGTWHLPSDG